MKKGLIGFGIFLLIILGWALIEAARLPDNRNISEEEQAENLIANYELIKDKIIDPETVDLSTLPVKQKDQPENLSKQPYVVIRKHKESNKMVWEIEDSISELNEDLWVCEKWNEQDLKKIPVFVFAVSDYRERTYHYVSGGVGYATITSEGVSIYFYNPKTDTVFKTERMEAKELPESTSSAADYEKSLYDVEHTIKKSLGRFTMPGWTAGLLGLFGMFSFFALIGVFMTLRRTE